MTESAPGVTAIILCGGGARRFGADKLGQPLGPTTVLGFLVNSLPRVWEVVAVGAPRSLARPVTWVLEDPPDGGPLAGIAAGVAVVTTEHVVVLGGDMPFVGPWARQIAGELAASDDPEVAGVCARGDDGRDNPLLAAYQTAAVHAALPPQSRNGRAGLLVDRIPHRSLSVPAADLLDVDTPAALEVARGRVEPGAGHMPG